MIILGGRLELILVNNWFYMAEVAATVWNLLVMGSINSAVYLVDLCHKYYCKLALYSVDSDLYIHVEHVEWRSI